MVAPTQNGPLELILQLLANKRMPMQPSQGLRNHLLPYAEEQLQGRGRAPDMTNVIDPIGRAGGGPPGARTGAPPPISRDPWFDEVQRPPQGAFQQSEGYGEFDHPMGSPEWATQRQTLVRDLMRATGIEGRGSGERYYSQLLEVNDAFVRRIAEKLDLITEGKDGKASPNMLRRLIANEFEHFGDNG